MVKVAVLDKGWKRMGVEKVEIFRQIVENGEKAGMPEGVVQHSARKRRFILKIAGNMI